MGNRDLPPYLYRDGAGFYLVHPVTREKARLGRDRIEALTVYAAAAAEWEGAIAAARAERLASRIQRAAAPAERRLTLAAYCQQWREKVLPTITKRNGAPLGAKTRADYGRMLRQQVEPSEQAKTPIGDVDAVVLRKLLAGWLDSPTFYNYLKAVLSRVLAHAVDEGLLRTNPIGDVARRAVPKKGTYVTDADYAAITAKLEDWQAQACDLIYLLGSRPGDALRLTEDDFTEWDSPRMVRLEDGREVALYGVLRYRASKNGALIDVEVNEALRAVLHWFRAWKRAQGFHGAVRGFVVYPVSAPRRARGKPVPVEKLSRAFAAAVVAAELPAGTYTLRDLRPKGLTDDWLDGGAGDKGGHKTEAMRNHYRRVEVPFRARNTLAAIPRKAG